MSVVVSVDWELTPVMNQAVLLAEGVTACSSGGVDIASFIPALQDRLTLLKLN